MRTGDDTNDYRGRTYLSAVEAAKYLGITVSGLHRLAAEKIIAVQIAASGQMRFALAELKIYETAQPALREQTTPKRKKKYEFIIGSTTQQLIVGSSTSMKEVRDESVHLMLTSPPYFNAKMYARETLAENLGDVNDIDEWFEKIRVVWQETFRVLQAGRKMFINIMNLPIRTEGGGYRTLNLVGRTIEECEKIGFIFKRDIVWQKTNGVRAHFGTYPYPGGILINNMHEFILEFDKPRSRKSPSKYAHLTDAQKEASKLDKDFWLSLKNSDVWLMKPEASGENRNHVAPFPSELPYRLIKAFSYESETVLDPFAGSGTTLRVAADLRRNGIGYELSPEIAADAAKMLKALQMEPL